ncbi:MAG: adenylyltransferase/cytidyltransferase family protein, partial [Selenomonadaceae bacterium]|nr:adenylyltransferase/cytidyltransferase family protein [Selenomonadaceae bacterium]
ASSFDAILSIASLEKHGNPAKVLSVWRKLLKPKGRLLLGMNNRFGLRYFCGDRDPYTGRNFDGLDGYRRAYRKKEDMFYGRMYSQEEIREMLQVSGWEHVKFYSALPDLENCTLLYAEGTLPKEDLMNRLFPTYHSPDTVFLEEKELYDGIIRNGMFHKMANAYFVECSLSGEFSDVLHVTSSMERGREHAFFTVIHEGGRVEKRAAYSEGQEHLRQMATNMERLQARGIPVVESHMEGDCLVMPYMTGENGLLYLQGLLREDKEKFLKALDRFCDLVLRSSEIEKEDVDDGEGVLLRYGYPDMVPWNSFFQDGEFVFFDQEFCEKHYPANAVLVRTIGAFQGLGEQIYGSGFSKDFLFQRYGLLKERERWQKMEGKFFGKILQRDELRLYHEKCWHNPQAVYTNRQRMNFSAEEYQRLFVDIFQGMEGKRLILFGSGRYADQFLALYGKAHPVEFVVDNNGKRWGEAVAGLSIRSPEALGELADGSYRVLVCIKDYLSVLRQLKEMGVKDYAIFDPNRDYPRPREAYVQKGSGSAEAEVSGEPARKYHVGYIAGVFDLFHIGHLNMFRRAKEQCDYLIVGVVPDAAVRRNKEVEPFIPFEERIEMVRSCRYVDEAVEIPENYGGTRDAWRMYHFDSQLSGSDYIDNNDWLAEKEFLEKHGATLVFFPYTEQTSSTKIKALINQKLAKK